MKSKLLYVKRHTPEFYAQQDYQKPPTSLAHLQLTADQSSEAYKKITKYSPEE